MTAADPAETGPEPEADLEVDAEADPAADVEAGGDPTEPETDESPVVPTACPSCGEPTIPEDRFCEACGATVSDAADDEQPDPDGEVAVTRASDDTTCPSCGASGADATSDGYCGLCGRRWSPVREHVELVDGPLAAVCDRGTDHWRNEDAVGIAALAADRYVIVVCDGVSASHDPHVVSQAAVDASVASLRNTLAAGADLEEGMRAAVAVAQEAAAAVPNDPNVGIGPGACTFVAVAVRGHEAVFGQVGDSRAYWVDGDGAVQVGRDDSLAAELVASGRVTPEQAVRHVGGHAITKWLGADAAEPTPTVIRRDLSGPGLVLLVSDGLWNYVPAADELAKLVGPLGDETPLALARRLVAFAEESGGADNITVAVGPYDLDELEAADQEQEEERDA